MGKRHRNRDRDDGDDEERIEVESLVSGTPGSANYLSGLVHISWGDKSAHMSIKDARHHAISVLEAAGAAEQDELYDALAHDDDALAA